MGNYIVCNDELYHHGTKGMKWGVRKKRESKTDKYGNNRKGSSLLLPHKKILSTVEDVALNKQDSITKLRNKMDENAIKYETKGMNDKQKKLFALNYYNDMKKVSEISGKETRDQLDKLNGSNKRRSEQLAINLMGSDFLRKTANLKIKYAEADLERYQKKIDDLLKEMGDIKLSTITSRRQVTVGNSTYSWLGDEYVEKP